MINHRRSLVILLLIFSLEWLLAWEFGFALSKEEVGAQEDVHPAEDEIMEPAPHDDLLDDSPLVNYYFPMLKDDIRNK